MIDGFVDVLYKFKNSVELFKLRFTRVSKRQRVEISDYFRSLSMAKK
jgi:hypothetical protein